MPASSRPSLSCCLSQHADRTDIEENGQNGSHVLAGHEVIVGVGPVQIERRHVELLGDNSSEILGDLACDVGDVAWEQLSGVSGTGNTRVQNFPHR